MEILTDNILHPFRLLLQMDSFHIPFCICLKGRGITVHSCIIGIRILWMLVAFSQLATPSKHEEERRLWS